MFSGINPTSATGHNTGTIDTTYQPFTNQVTGTTDTTYQPLSDQTIGATGTMYEPLTGQTTTYETSMDQTMRTIDTIYQPLSDQTIATTGTTYQPFTDQNDDPFLKLCESQTIHDHASHRSEQNEFLLKENNEGTVTPFGRIHQTNALTSQTRYSHLNPQTYNYELDSLDGSPEHDTPPMLFKSEHCEDQYYSMDPVDALPDNCNVNNVTNVDLQSDNAQTEDESPSQPVTTSTDIKTDDTEV